MTHVQQSIANFKERMKTTFQVSLSPWSLLYGLFTVDGSGDYGFIFKFGALFFGITSSPVLLAAGVITVGLGIVAGIVQSFIFPFQLLASQIQDTFSPLPTVTPSKAYPLTQVQNCDAEKSLEQDQVPGHFSSLFEMKNPHEELGKKHLMEQDTSEDSASVAQRVL
ncbi:hypothetical protein [Legionella maioricensis]|uniref:Uncharacterized protein n=1 Tax=Legionella maioricensis TaxID=2896528 RepID=A0A9X2CY89_9GAMM|nr:hypothetical protein [Legionella maioricensis]MCL9683094.1 hypothetical protein [Legionella maioricensis]MCL9686442.1 hypothetical protein [Legionella maioricensis]